MSKHIGEPAIVRADKSSIPLHKLSLLPGAGHDLGEAWLQDLLFREPNLLPAAQIHSSYASLIPVCRELVTDAGKLDLLYVTPMGDLVIVETKLWRNPQARREVIGQILDYASELSRWSYEDLQRMLAGKLGQQGNNLFRLVAAQYPETDEKEFCDRVARSLRLGQFLLLVVGDGIQEGARQIADFLVDKSSLAFHLGMVDMEAYEVPGIGRLVIPRVQARTEVIRRFVLLPTSDMSDLEAQSEEVESTGPESDDATERRRASALQFWSEVLDGLRFDDQTQPMAKPVRGGNIRFPGPPDADGASIKAFFAINNNDRVGVYLALGTSAEARVLYEALKKEQQALEFEIGESLEFSDSRSGPYILASKNVGDVLGGDRQEVLAYLKSTLNKFVTSFRHRVKRWYGEGRDA